MSVSHSSPLVLASVAFATLTLATADARAQPVAAPRIDPPFNKTPPPMSSSRPSSLHRAPSSSYVPGPPKKPAAPGEVLEIGAGYRFACARATAGVWCWGTQSRVGSAKSSPPTWVELHAPSQLAVSDFSACALVNARVFCWGDSLFAGVGSAPTELEALPFRVLRIAGGGDNMCAISEKNQLWCWGRNDGGQLGVGTSDSERHPPTRVEALSDVRDVSVGSSGTICAITTADELYCWGQNGAGQLGLNTTVSQPQPKHVAALTDVESVAVGKLATCATRSKGQVYCWGALPDINGYVKTVTHKTPQRRAELGAVDELAVGRHWHCGVNTGGTLRCRGFADMWIGGLGTEAPIDATKTPVNMMLGNVTDVAIGSGSTHAVADPFICAIAAGDVYCWGRNGSGQLGLPHKLNRNAPQRVKLE